MTRSTTDVATSPLLRASPGVADTVAALGDGARTAAAEAVSRLEAFAATEPEIHAWAHVDPDLVRRQAAALDAAQAEGRAAGPLQGVAIGFKDVIDTNDQPTENGSPIDAGRRPSQDAAVVARLRAAGAIIFGKTITTELAYFAPGPSRNPHDLSRTPGGSSSGSAAAVAAGVVPAALGTQTNGSVVRPASFCGVVGYKPSFGVIPRAGVLDDSRSLDVVGVFARSVADAALVAAPLFGAHPGDPQCREGSGVSFLATALAAPPTPIRFAVVRTPAWDKADPDARAAFEAFCAGLGDAAADLELPGAFAESYRLHRTIMASEMAESLSDHVDRAPDRVSDTLKALVSEGRAVSAPAYLAAKRAQAAMIAAAPAIFDGVDAFLSLSAPGEAPAGIESTGDPVFNTIWSLIGAPAASLPLLRGSNGLPLGLQVIGRPGDDARLLRTATALMRRADG